MATLFNTRIADTYQGLIKTLDNGVLNATLAQISDGSGNGTGIFLNTGGDLKATGIVSFGSLKDTAENITITKFVDAADGLVNNDNDTTMPTSAAIIDYVAAQVTLADLDFLGDSNVGLPSVDLDSQKFNVLGTANQITTSGSGQTLIISLPSSVTISGAFTATTFIGDLNGTINTLTTAVTQPIGDNSTKIATTAFVDRVITAQDLDFQGTTGSGSVDLDSQVLIIKGTTNEITTVGGAQTLTIGLPLSITTNLVGNVTGNVTGNLTGDVTGNTTGLHTGNVVGNVTGNLTGDVTGDLTGNTTGLHTGNVVGNVTGDLVGAVTGNVTGNLTGDVTGNLTGDVTGDVTGSVTGNVTGNLTGDVTGNVTGDLTGNADTATAWATGRTISLTGEATGTSASLDGTASVSAAVTLTNSSVIDKVLTGLQSPAGATISATDSMLVAFGKLQSQINGIAEGLQFQGSWNASTNTPTLTSGVGTQGHYYIVSVAGSTNLDGITDWEVGDWAIYSTTSVWQRLDQTGVQGTGTIGNLTKWATGSTISDSIVSESGTALTVTGSLTTTLATTVDGNLTVGTDSLIVNSVSDAVSMVGILTVASPVINTGISGSAILDDDTFGTANATTVATSESIKAYVDAQDQGSGTVGTIAKFATATTFNNSVITQSSTDLFLGGETYIPSNQLIIGANNQNASTEYLILDGSGTDISTYNTIFSFNRGLSIGTQSAEPFTIDTANQTRLTISSGGTATFDGDVNISGKKLNISAPSGGNAYIKFSDTNSGAKNWRVGTSLSSRGVFNIYNETDDLLALNILADGKVGIGTTNPLNKFVVSEGTNQHGVEISPGTLSYIQAYDRATGDYGNLQIDSEQIAFGTNNGTVRLTISSLGLATFQSSIQEKVKLVASSNEYLSLSLANNSGTTQWEVGKDNNNGFFIYRGGGGSDQGFKLSIGSGGHIIQDTSSATSTYFQVRDRGTTRGYFGTADALLNAPTTNSQFCIRSEDDFAIATGGGTRRLIISSTGNVGIGGTSSSSKLYMYGNVNGYLAYFYNDGNDQNYGGIRLNGGANNGSGTTYYLRCDDGDATEVGGLRNNNGTFQLYDSSDRSLKENIEDTDIKGLDRINALKVRKFNWKKNGILNVAGFVAQEVENVIPEASSPMDSGLLSVSVTSMVPTLVKAIQEQQTIIDTLTARLDALENKR